MQRSWLKQATEFKSVSCDKNSPILSRLLRNWVISLNGWLYFLAPISQVQFFLLAIVTTPEDCHTAFAKIAVPSGLSQWTAGTGASVYASPQRTEKGCFGYFVGQLTGYYFFGTQGTVDQMSTELSSPKFRPQGKSSSDQSSTVLHAKSYLKSSWLGGKKLNSLSQKN